MGLSEQAIRLKRMDYGDRTDLLRDEIYLAFLTDIDPALSPVNITFPDGTDPITLPPGVTKGPGDSFQLPDLIFPDLILPEGQPQLGDTPVGDDGQDGDNETPTKKKQKTRTQTQHDRTAVPAIIVGGAGPQYSVSVYPNGSTGGHIAVATSTADDGAISGGATDLNFAVTGALTAGLWILLFRHTTVEIKTTQFIEVLANGVERVVREQVDVNVLEINYEFAGSTGGGGNAFPGTVTSGTGSDYVCDIVTGSGTESVSVTQLQIDPAETIPVGTSAVVVKVGDSYYMQVAVWM